MIEVFIGGIMSNQGPGKIEKKLDRNGDMIKSISFLRLLRNYLMIVVKKTRFYMEQMVDYLKSGKLTSEELKSEESIIKVNDGL